jgi:hypothetical protein
MKRKIFYTSNARILFLSKKVRFSTKSDRTGDEENIKMDKCQEIAGTNG